MFTQFILVCTIHVGGPEIRDDIFMIHWGLCHIWDMHNGFVFDGRHGVEAYIGKLKGVLIWHFSLFE